MIIKIYMIIKVILNYWDNYPIYFIINISILYINIHDY